MFSVVIVKEKNLSTITFPPALFPLNVSSLGNGSALPNVLKSPNSRINPDVISVRCEGVCFTTGSHPTSQKTS